jgi:hypothetical protein
MGKVISMTDYLKSRRDKSEAFDMMFINSTIKQQGENWVASAIENQVDVDEGNVFLIRPVFNVDERVSYKDSQEPNYGTVVAIEMVDNIIWYKIAWDDGEPTDLYRDTQLEKVQDKK